jgi:NADP-dependent 3-hydroxy acid dehydrogenase YdfG
MRIAGSTVLVTGASSGIGAATARAVARAGGRPVLLARSAGTLHELAAELGGGVRAYAVDCADRDAVARVAPQIAEEVGTPDVVVNNAGAGRWLYLEETEPEELEAMIGAPFLAAAFVTRAFLPAMIERGSGLIVNVNSPIAFIPWPGAAGYGAARWALRGLDQLLRVDLAGTGVHVAQVVPGPVSSDYILHNPGVGESFPGVAKLIPTLTPDEVASTILRTIEREPRLVFTPFVLRLFMSLDRVVPRVVPWVARRTGRKRAGRLA